MQSALVSSEWLAAHLSDPKLVILDASMDKVIGREPIVYDEPCFIAGARRLDLERECTDLQSSELHALPSQAQFTELVQGLGIDQDCTVVIYDNQGIYSSPRGSRRRSAQMAQRAAPLRRQAGDRVSAR
ncbi:MAG: hypothetical protein Sw2LagTSB_35130 [Shewanella algae]